MTVERRHTELSRCLADVFLAGAWTEDAMTRRATEALQPRPRWLRRLAREVLAVYHRPPADRPRELAGVVAHHLEQWARLESWVEPRIRRWRVPEPSMGRRRWPVPEVASPAELARFLYLSESQLEWMADVRGLERSVKSTALRHYHYDWVPRPHAPRRPIERPKARLKAVQRRVLHELLDWIPAHDAAHGFTRGRSARSHAARHTGRDVVLRLDLEDFFASVAAGRVYGIFRTAGYPEAVAHKLTGLTTNAVPMAEWAALPRPTEPRLIQSHHRLGRRLATPHLPQGAPTSPALANLAAFRLDRRLHGLARALEARYSRYADDLTFSGARNLMARSSRLRATVAEIAREEGFRVNPGKTMLCTRAGRQRVCGVVVNEHPNPPRVDYDRLKAVLHDAALRGPGAANRGGVPEFRAHLLGRISWMEQLNPARAVRLREEFARIDWSD